LRVKALKRKARSLVALLIVFSIVLMPLSVIAETGSDSGGADAGVGDAGVGDAGVGDAGVGDAGGADAGAGDAGGADAGAEDAGSGDVGEADVDAGDVGEADVDAGGADAGAGDAGGADAGAGDADAGDAGEADVDAGDVGEADVDAGDVGEADVDAGGADAGAGDADAGDAGAGESSEVAIAEEVSGGGNSYIAFIDGVVRKDLASTEFKVAFAEVGDSQIGSWKLTIPNLDFIVENQESISTTDSVGRIWTGGLVDYVLSLHAQDAGVSLTQGEYVVTSFMATPKSFGTHTLTTEAWTDNNYGNSGGQKNDPAINTDYDGNSYTYNEKNLEVVVSNTIQGAIDSSATKDWSEIVVVYDGIYEEKLDINKSIHLKSANGPDSTTIQGDTIDLKADNIILDGFTIDNEDQSDGRAIAPRGTSGAAIINNIITNAFRGIQGDYYGVPECLYIADNVFEDSVSYGIAGTENMNSLWIEGNTFKTKAEAIGLGAGVVLVRDGQGGI